ncbi:MAG: membrane protein of unknown function [Anaerolineales bacterium]|nr:membrane protein of unknown function [Anaerolineales bacterium]
MATDAELELLISARDEATATIGMVERKASGLGTTLATVVRTGALAGGAAIAGFGIASINAAANFESAMDQVGAVANATEDDLDALSTKGLEIGQRTMFGATEAANAMEILAANGVSVSDILEGAADAAVDLAAAGGTDLRIAADVASTSMAVWKLRGEDMVDVVNRLAGAANVSRFGVEDMSMAIAQGGGAAATAGVEFGDFTTAIAAIAPSFSSGADAGTSFKTFLVALTPQSDKAAASMKELGLITEDGSNQFFDAAGNLRSMSEVTQLLHNATSGLTEQQRLSSLQTIFGTDAMRAAAAVSALTGEEFQKMSDTMKNTDAQEVAKQRMDNFKGSMDALKGTIDTIMIQIGMEFLPTLQSLADWLNVTGIPSVQAWMDENKEDWVEIVEVVQSAASVILPIVEALLKSIGAAFDFWFSAVLGLLHIFKGAFTGDWQLFLQGIVEFAVAPLDFVKALFGNTWDAINTISGGKLDEIKTTIVNKAVGFYEAGRAIALGFGNGIIDGFNAAFQIVNTGLPDRIDLPWPMPDIDLPDNPFPMIPHLAAGAVVRARPGGVVARLGEGRLDEAVIPLAPGMARMLSTSTGGGGVYVAPGAIQIIMPHAAFVDEDALRRIGPQLVTVVRGELERERF